MRVMPALAVCGKELKEQSRVLRRDHVRAK